VAINLCFVPQSPLESLFMFFLWATMGVPLLAIGRLAPTRTSSDFQYAWEIYIFTKIYFCILLEGWIWWIAHAAWVNRHGNPSYRKEKLGCLWCTTSDGEATSIVTFNIYGFSTLCFHAARQMHARVVFFYNILSCILFISKWLSQLWVVFFYKL